MRRNTVYGFKKLFLPDYPALLRQMKQYFIHFKYQYFINCWITYIGTESISEEYLGAKKYTAVKDLKKLNLFSISGSEDDLIAEQEFSCGEDSE